MKKQATYLREADGFTGDARLYRLSEPLEDSSYVIVSAVPFAFDTGMAETYLFSANEEGDVTSWSDLDGSFQGAMDHARALANAGYEIVEPDVRA